MLEDQDHCEYLFVAIVSSDPQSFYRQFGARSIARDASDIQPSANNSTTSTMSTDQKGIRQIPIVCPGHTRPLAELQFLRVKEEDRTFLVSACHGKSDDDGMHVVVMWCFVQL